MTETVHQCPPQGSGIMPCCGRTPFEVGAERLTLDGGSVTCKPTTPLRTRTLQVTLAEVPTSVLVYLVDERGWRVTHEIVAAVAPDGFTNAVGPVRSALALLKEAGYVTVDNCGGFAATPSGVSAVEAARAAADKGDPAAASTYAADEPGARWADGCLVADGHDRGAACVLPAWQP